MANATVVMKLEGPIGPIDGECTVDGYERYIVLENWSWTLNEKDKKFVPGGISFSKVSDRSTVPMLKLLQACEDAPSAEILVEEDSVDSKLELRLKLINVRFTKYTLSSNLDDKSGTLNENWTVRADEAQLTYRSHGGKKVGPFKVFWDPNAEATSPEDVVEDEIVGMVVKKVREERLKPLLARIEKDYAKRKTERAPQGDKQEI
jgi:hypothetical protein